jgi:O-antigen/teichoic acid export membrane protein
MPSDNRSALARNAAYLISARFVPRLLQIIYMIILARYLGPELYGQFAYGQSWYLALLPLTSFGLYLLLSKAIGTKQEDATNTLAHTLAFRTGLATSVALLSMGAAQLFEPDHMTRMALFVFSLALLGRAIVNWTEHAFVAFEAPLYALRCELWFRPLECIVGVLMLIAGGKVLAVATLHAFIWFLHAGTALMLVHRRLAPVRFRCDWVTVRELFGFGWPLSLNVFCTGFLLQGPIVLYRYFAPTDPHVGQIAMPLQAMAILCIVPAAVSSSSLPVLARSVHRADRQELIVGEAMLRLGYGFGTVVGLIGLAMGSWLVDTFLGARYAVAGSLIGPALWLVIPYACAHALASICLVHGRILAVLACSASGALVLVVTVPLFTLWLGNLGIVAATAVALLCWMLLLTVICVLAGENHVRVWLIRPTVWASMGLAAYAMVQPLSTLLALGISLLVLWLAAPLTGVMQPHELRAMRKLFAARMV